MKRWIYPGSFDPPTLGHEDVIVRSSKLCDELIVAVLDNKKKHALFTVAQRIEMLRRMTKELGNVTIVSFEGLQKSLYSALNATAVVRGVRTAADVDFELSLARVNDMLLPGFETVLLPARNEYANISSSFVRELMAFNGDYGLMLNAEVYEYIQDAFENKEEEK